MLEEIEDDISESYLLKLEQIFEELRLRRKRLIAEVRVAEQRAD